MYINIIYTNTLFCVFSFFDIVFSCHYGNIARCCAVCCCQNPSFVKNSTSTKMTWKALQRNLMWEFAPWGISTPDNSVLQSSKFIMLTCWIIINYKCLLCGFLVKINVIVIIEENCLILNRTYKATIVHKIMI